MPESTSIFSQECMEIDVFRDPLFECSRCIKISPTCRGANHWPISRPKKLTGQHVYYASLNFQAKAD